MNPIRMVGGPADGQTMGVNNATNLCVPVGDGYGGYRTAVYYPDEAQVTAYYDRTILWADEPDITPIDESLARALSFKGCILELGSGVSTHWLRNFCDIVSIEDNPSFYGVFNSWRDTIAAPRAGDFYDRGVLLRCLNRVKNYQALFVDGPDTEKRVWGLIECLDLFNPRVDWYFDDWSMPSIQAGIKDIASRQNRVIEEVTNCSKPWAKLRAAK